MKSYIIIKILFEGFLIKNNLKLNKSQSILFKVSLFMILFTILVALSILLSISYIKKSELEKSAFSNSVVIAQKVASELEQKKIRAKILAMTLANFGEIMKSDEEYNKIALKKLIDIEGLGKFIAGGGIWPEPFAFNPNKERDSYFFGRNKEETLSFYNDYNDPTSAGYHHEDWYLPAKNLKETEASWSKSYVDPYSFEPMVTVTIPMYKKEKFIGVSTIDVMLNGIDDFLKESTKESKGYGFLLDSENKFISFPLTKIIQNSDAKGTMFFDEFVKHEQSYTELNEIINSNKSSEVKSVIIKNDALLKTETLANILYQKDTGWTLVVVIPVSEILAQSDRTTKSLIAIILPIIALLFLIAYYAIKKMIVTPIMALSSELENSSDQNTLLKTTKNDELGVLVYLFNKRTSELMDKTEKLSDLTESLEQKVSERTKELAEINKEVQDSIEYASTIQRSFLKHSSFIEEKFSDSFVIWQPRDKVGGDLYIYEEAQEGILFGVVDCTGHSVPGGFMTMLAGSIIKKLATEHFTNPAKLLSELNIAIKQQLSQDEKNSLSDDGLDIGLCYINKEGTILKFAGAKIDLLYFKENKSYIIKSNKQSIGYKRSKSDYEYTNHEIHIDACEEFYLYTDGITDQTGGDRNFPYGSKKFKEFISDIRDKAMKEQRELILENLSHYQGENTRRDDVTVIGFKIKKGVQA
jgi:serine phosphatase RsbU (regulator of sigma subunit)